MHEHYDSYREPYPYVVILKTRNSFYDYISWLEENIGEHWVEWNIQTSQGIGLVNCYLFKFVTKENAMAFKLRWL